MDENYKSRGLDESMDKIRCLIFIRKEKIFVIMEVNVTGLTTE